LARLRGQLVKAEDLPALADWFVDAFGTLVIANLRIGGALFVATPWRWPEPPPVVTGRRARRLQDAQGEAASRPGDAVAIWRAFAGRWGHRGEYESDPAGPRDGERYSPGTAMPLDPSPFLPDPLAELPVLLRALPFLAPGHLLAHRE